MLNTNIYVGRLFSFRNELGVVLVVSTITPGNTFLIQAQAQLLNMNFLKALKHAMEIYTQSLPFTTPFRCLCDGFSNFNAHFD